MIRILALVVLALGPALTHAAEAPPPVITDPCARASILQSRPAAGYLTMESDQGDRLIGATSPVAERILVHAVEAADGMSPMAHLPTLDLEPGKPVSMGPGLRTMLTEGSEFRLTLELQEAGEIAVLMPVLGAGASGPAPGGTDE